MNEQFVSKSGIQVIVDESDDIIGVTEEEIKDEGFDKEILKESLQKEEE